MARMDRSDVVARRIALARGAAAPYQALPEAWCGTNALLEEEQLIQAQVGLEVRRGSDSAIAMVVVATVGVALLISGMEVAGVLVIGSSLIVGSLMENPS